MDNKLLVIDDDLGVLNMTCDYFAFCGFEVYKARDGLEGIEVCAQVRPDVVLIDLKMRRMSGAQAIPHLRQLVPNATIFLISGYPELLEDARVKNLDVDACFEKPVSIKDVQEAIWHAVHLGQHADYRSQPAVSTRDEVTNKTFEIESQTQEAG